MTRARLAPVLPAELEDLRAAFRDFEQHFAALLQLPQVPRPFEGNPLTMPGYEVYWLEKQEQRYGFVMLEQVETPTRQTGIQINRYGVFSQFRDRGWGAEGLPLLEAHVIAAGLPVTWSCWLMNPALGFWERWAQELIGKGWHVEMRPRVSSPPARTYIAWPPDVEEVDYGRERRSDI